MIARSEITRQVDRSPLGPKIAAFFDVDRTLLAGFSAGAFMRERLRAGHFDPASVLRAVSAAVRFSLRQTSFPTLVRESTIGWKGMREEELRELAERVFAQSLATEIYPESRALVEAHQRRRHTVAIVSSATHYQIDPLARDLGISHVLCTELEIRHGRFTGEVVRPACFGEGKAEAARRFAAEHEIELDRSYFYSDSSDDLPLLDLVGYPRPVNPDRTLAAIATRRGWPIRRFRSRGRPGPEDLVRTGLVLASVGPALLAGVPAALLNRSLRQFLNVGMTTFGELATAAAGIELRVEGEEHLWSARPAVFIFNHQSAIDPVLIAKLLRRDVMAVAQRELRLPILGALAEFAGVTVYVDRADRERAIEALKPAVDALRRGISVAIAPEGTRMPTPRLGRFKKGAFRIALAARVPIVPIVLRNALDALPRRGRIVRPAVVEVVVHPPIPTVDWKLEELDAYIDEVRAIFERELQPA